MRYVLSAPHLSLLTVSTPQPPLFAFALRSPPLFPLLPQTLLAFYLPLPQPSSPHIYYCPNPLPILSTSTSRLPTPLFVSARHSSPFILFCSTLFSLFISFRDMEICCRYAKTQISNRVKNAYIIGVMPIGPRCHCLYANLLLSPV